MSYTQIALISLLLSLCLTGHAQEVYQSTDSEGNVTFSDQPGDAGTAVQVPEPNVGDSVEVPPPSPEPVQQAPEGELMEGIPENLEGRLEADRERSKKRSRPRKEPRGGR